jgi:hypothetical protein
MTVALLPSHAGAVMIAVAAVQKGCAAATHSRKYQVVPILVHIVLRTLVHVVLRAGTPDVCMLCTLHACYEYASSAAAASVQ